MSPRTARRAFSLVELLVVVTILALLAAILFPVFAQARRRSVQAACLSSLKGTGAAIALYQADWNDLLPSGKVYMHPGVPSPYRDVMEPLTVYAPGEGALRCPLGHHRYGGRWIVQLGRPQESRLMVPYPSNVLLRCVHHLDEGWSGGSDWESVTSLAAQRGRHLVLRADLSAQAYDARTIRNMKMVKVGSEERWESSSTFDGPEEERAGVYLAEEWPPKWSRLPENAGLGWGGAE